MSVSQEQKEAEKLVGQVLNGTYRLEQLLVTGGMVRCFRARHVRTGGVCAIKVLHQRAAMQGDLSERFQDEARIIAGLRHPNIVQVSDLDRDRSGMAFIVMELLEGEDLQDRIERTGKIPWKKRSRSPGKSRRHCMPPTSAGSFTGISSHATSSCRITKNTAK